MADKIEIKCPLRLVNYNWSIEKALTKIIN